MFEWLKNLLFDEEVEEIEEDKLEKIDFTKVNNFDNIVKETPKEEKEIKQEEVKEVKEEKEVVEEVPQIKKEFNIQLEPTPKQVKKEVQPQVEVRSRRERTEKKSPEKEIEIGSVISPMFGGGEVKKSETTVKPVLTTKKRDSLGTVISPMYGQEELFNHEKEALTKINENKIETLVVNDDDWKNDIPLEELISNEEENNDCVQFSLFGDETINE